MQVYQDNTSYIFLGWVTPIITLHTKEDAFRAEPHDEARPVRVFYKQAEAEAYLREAK